ncbi:hypothetical protein A3C05_01200 [Candidatus Giovannonibacteria bacterium RIFCSPHIGHO2_02_FULL_45_40]|uniref:Uncharacterized protein n=1 Tax=Candidatus Giovannonibacteria bacterium RIFCSPHIGHO2_02_FULL_45_40 TaxID=1798337 RepID=A0A1F5W7L4_9BACT|nr:MAG: hypothetical protein A3C05_01200 [Candidatus Giovannonibacteria bacterium RIFCSPHIGHO2_02_FULL_45_40]
MENKNGEQEHPKGQWSQSDLCECNHFRSHHPKLKRFTDGNHIPIGGWCDENCPCKKFVLKAKQNML